MRNVSRKSVSYMGIPIEYTLTRKPVKNINIRINEHGEIMVSAGRRVPSGYINDFVESRAEWIIRNLAAIERYNETKPDSGVYTGKKVYFLGQLCVIDVEEGDGERVLIDGNVISIYTKKADDHEAVKKMYLKWLYTEAEKVFSLRMEEIYSIISGEGVPRAALDIRNMKSVWGTCNIEKCKITLNLQLIKADVKCIDQVILHEYMHFKVRNHGADFYKLIDKYMSDWREYKKDLEEKYKDGI